MPEVESWVVAEGTDIDTTRASETCSSSTRCSRNTTGGGATPTAGPSADGVVATRQRRADAGADRRRAAARPTRRGALHLDRLSAAAVLFFL